MQVVMSLVGVATIFLIALALSSNRSAINARTASMAFLVQTAIAALVLFVPAGGLVLDKVVKGVQTVINYGNNGIEFVLGAFIQASLGFTIAFNVLPVIVFFAALMSVLCYLGLMQRVVTLRSAAYPIWRPAPFCSVGWARSRRPDVTTSRGLVFAPLLRVHWWT